MVGDGDCGSDSGTCGRGVVILIMVVVAIFVEGDCGKEMGDIQVSINLIRIKQALVIQFCILIS